MIYSIFDKVSKQWSAPFIMTNDETAIRSWKHDCQKVPAEYLGDYDLYSIGYWNPTGLSDSKESEKVLLILFHLLERISFLNLFCLDLLSLRKNRKFLILRLVNNG